MYMYFRSFNISFPFIFNFLIIPESFQSSLDPDPGRYDASVLGPCRLTIQIQMKLFTLKGRLTNLDCVPV